jgi:selenocysteine lyase/cysteine desulfurase
MARSLGWLSMYVGLDYVHRRGTALALAAARRLAGIRGVTVITPVDRMATLVTFRIAGWPAQAAIDELGARVFAIARTVPGMEALRISVGFFNSEDELERFAGTVEPLAGTRPIRCRRAACSRSSTTDDERPPRRSWAEVRWRQFRHALARSSER